MLQILSMVLLLIYPPMANLSRPWLYCVVNIASLIRNNFVVSTRENFKFYACTPKVFISIPIFLFGYFLHIEEEIFQLKWRSCCSTKVKSNKILHGYGPKVLYNRNSLFTKENKYLCNALV